MVFVTVLLDSPSGGPTVGGADAWRQSYGLQNVYVVSDHDLNGNAKFSMVPGNSVGTPQITIVDPRTMQVVAIQEGWGGSEPPALLNLAAANSATRPRHPTAPVE